VSCGGRRTVNVTKTRKWMERKRRKKTKDPAKKGVGKNSKIFGLHGARENRPITPTKRAPRPALWTTSTSGKVLDYELSNIFTLI
jgi:hypothetical protein